MKPSVIVGKAALAFVTANRRWLLVGFLLFFLSSLGQTYFVALSLGDIRAHFGLSLGAIGMINMGLTLISGLVVFWTGGVSDRLSARAMILILIPMLALGALLFQSLLSLPVVLLGLFTLRVGAQGLMTHLAFVTVGRWFQGQRGMAIALTSMGQNAGQMALPFGFVALSTALGWQGTWLVLVGLLIPTLPLLVRLAAVERVPEPVTQTIDRPRPSVPDLTRGEVLRRADFHAFLFAILPLAFVANTIFFYQVELVAARGWSLDTFTASYSVMAIFTILSGFWAGALVDRHSAVTLLPYYLGPLILACLLLAFVKAEGVVFVFMVLMGISNGFSLNLYGTVWPEAYGTAHLGAIRSIVTMVALFAAAAGPGLAGLLLDRGVAFSTLFLGLAGLCALASAVVWPFSRGA